MATRSIPIEPEDDEEELLESIENLSPLAALDAEEVDKLSQRQQAFLVHFVNTNSITLAKKQAGVKPKDWAAWNQDPQFTKMYAICKTPLAFALNLKQALLLKAARKHWALMDHERVSVQQWAIERAYALPPLFGSDDPEKSGSGPLLTQADAKRLANQVVAQLEEAKDTSLNPSPFIVPATKHTIIESTPEAPNTGSVTD